MSADHRVFGDRDPERSSLIPLPRRCNNPHHWGRSVETHSNGLKPVRRRRHLSNSQLQRKPASENVKHSSTQVDRNRRLTPDIWRYHNANMRALDDVRRALSARLCARWLPALRAAGSAPDPREACSVVVCRRSPAKCDDLRVRRCSIESDAGLSRTRDVKLRQTPAQ